MNCPDCHCPRGEPLTVAANSLVTRCHNAFHAVAVSPARPDDFATETAKDTTPPPPSHHRAAEALVCLVCGKAECSHGEANCSVCLRQLDDGHCRTEVCPRFDGESTWHENSPRDLPDPQTYKRSDTTCPTCGHDEHRSATCVGGCGCATGLRPACWPFDPNPPKLIPADNGFRWCHDCQSVAEAAGHECGKVEKFGEALVLAMSRALEADIRASFAESLLCAMFFSIQRRVDSGQNWNDAAGAVMADVIDAVRDE